MADTLKASWITDHAFEPRTRPFVGNKLRLPPCEWLCGYQRNTVVKPCNLGEAAHRETTIKRCLSR